MCSFELESHSATTLRTAAVEHIAVVGSSTTLSGPLTHTQQRCVGEVSVQIILLTTDLLDSSISEFDVKLPITNSVHVRGCTSSDNKLP